MYGVWESDRSSSGAAETTRLSRFDRAAGKRTGGMDVLSGGERGTEYKMHACTVQGTATRT